MRKLLFSCLVANLLLCALIVRAQLELAETQVFFAMVDEWKHFRFNDPQPPESTIPQQLPTETQPPMQPPVTPPPIEKPAPIEPPIVKPAPIEPTMVKPPEILQTTTSLPPKAIETIQSPPLEPPTTVKPQQMKNQPTFDLQSILKMALNNSTV